MNFFLWALVVYLLLGLLLTGFCVHMSYHEAALGVADNDDLLAQRALETGPGFLGLFFLFLLWPVAIFLAFNRKSPSLPENGLSSAEERHATPESAPVETNN